MNRTAWLSLLSVPVVCFTTASAAAFGGAGEYEISLHRPAQTGQRYHVHGEGISHRSVTPMRDGMSQQSQDTRISIKFEADAEVTQVDANGRPVRVEFNIQECSAKLDGGATIIAAPGSTLTARWDNRAGTTHFEVDGSRVSGDAKQALELVADLEASGATEDQVTGTNRPQTVGSRWSIDSNNAARAIGRRIGQRVSADALDGTTTLVDVTEHNGERCLMLYTQISAANVVPGLRDVPAGFRLSDGTMSVTNHRLAPIDESKPIMTNFRQMDAEAVLKSSGGSNGFDELRFKVAQYVEVETTPIGGRSRTATPWNND